MVVVVVVVVEVLLHTKSSRLLLWLKQLMNGVKLATSSMDDDSADHI